MTKPCLLSVIVSLTLPASFSLADNFLVTSLLDDMGGGTLREAIAQADATPGDDTITFSTTGSVELNSALIVDNDGMGKTLIDASSVGEMIVVGSGTERVFEIEIDAVVEMAALFITGGQAPPGTDGTTGEFPTGGQNGGDGGGIQNFGDLTLRNCIVNFNFAGDGGTGGSYTGIATGDGASGGSGGRGGGIFSSGDTAILTLVNTTVDINSAGNGGQGGNGMNSGDGGTGGSGGGVYCEQGILNIQSSSIDSNDGGSGGNGGMPEAGGLGGEGGIGGSGGGLSVELGSLAMMDSVVSGNSAGQGGLGGGAGTIQPGPAGAGGNGGGIYANFFAESPAIEVDSSLIRQNRAGDGGNGGTSIGGIGSDGGDGGLGGGLHVETFPASAAVWDVVNTSIVQNFAGDSGGAGFGDTNGMAGVPGSGGGFAFLNDSGAGGMRFVHSVLHSNSAGENSDTFELGPGSAATGDVGLVLANSVVVFNSGLMGDDIDVFTAEGQNFIGGDPLLGPLQDNGGPTLTYAPVFGSPLIDGGGAITAPPSVDARNRGRLANFAPDLGSVEVTIQADAKIGSSSNPATHIVDNAYSPSGAGQVEYVKLRGRKTGKFYFSVENDGTIAAPFSLVGTAASSRMKFNVVQLTGGGNVTAAIAAGYALGNLAPGQLELFECTAKSKSKPNSKKKKKRKKVRENLLFRASVTGTALVDSVIASIKEKKK